MKSIYLALFILISQPAFSETPAASCDQVYKKIYRDNELNISLFLGYSDGDGNFVSDTFDRTNLAETLTGQCYEVSGEQFCGFKRDADDADTFTKTIVRSDGKTDQVKIRLMNSSFTPKHDENIGKYEKFQKKKTEKVSKAFNHALTTDEVVIYQGHARRGTGPGFQPMGALNWVNAVQSKPVLYNMTQNLRTAKTKPALIGMITCEGESHYGKVLNEASPTSALLLTRQTTSFSDAYSLLISSVDAILKKECAKDFRKTITNTVTTVYSTKFDGDTSVKDKLPEVYGLFEPITKKFAPARSTAVTYLKGELEKSSSRDDAEEKEKAAKLRKVDSPR